MLYEGVEMLFDQYSLTIISDVKNIADEEEVK